MDKIEELIAYFNNAYGMHKDWPKTFEVSVALYGRCCQAAFDNAKMHQGGEYYTEFMLFKIALGTRKNGLMFKNVELVIKEEV